VGLFSRQSSTTYTSSGNEIEMIMQLGSWEKDLRGEILDLEEVKEIER